MTTEIEPLIVEFTDETHEDQCNWCSKVAVWVATCIDMPCDHDEKLFCEPHKAELAAWRGAFECRECGAIGWELRWRRP